MVPGIERPRSQQTSRSATSLGHAPKRGPGLGVLLRTPPIDLLSPASRHVQQQAGQSTPGKRLLRDSLTASAGSLPWSACSTQDSFMGRVQTSGSGLASPTRLQNTRGKMFLEPRLGRSGSEVGGATIRPPGDDAEAEDMINEEDFADQVSNLSHSIEEIARNLRLDHLQKTSDAKAAARLEAARREKEAEIRRARKKEQMAKDPRRKVALKIERGRREAAEAYMQGSKGDEDAEPKKSSKQKAIPMVEFMAEDCTIDNKEGVEVVDVLAIQRRCQGLGHHQSVDEMLQLRRWQEKTQKPKNSSLRSGGCTGKIESGRWLFSSSALGAVSLEDKLALAKARRDGQRAEKIRRKLTNMRTECPLYLCRAYGLVDSQGNSILARSSYDDYSDSEYASLASSDEDIPHSRRSSGEAFASASAPAVSFSRKTLSRNTNRMTTRGTIFGQAGRKSAARKTIGGNADRARQEALARKVKKCKAIMRASVQWLKILFRKRRLHRAADACLVLLRHLGEWVHIRSAMKGFLQRVKTIQRTIREFLAIKHKRCHLIEKEWCRIEDQHLSVHAQHKVEIAMQETSGGQTRGPGRGKRRVLQAALEANVSSKNWKMVVDISSQRIPTAERKAIISAYHRRTLKRHMQIGKSFLQIVFDALHASRELDHYLNQFHYGNNARETMTLFEIKREDIVLDQQAQDLPYWHMAEAVILQLVACSAQALAHLPAFKEHPANHAIPADKRSSWLEYSPGFSPHEFAEFVLVQLDRPYFHGRFGRDPNRRESDIMMTEGRSPSRRETEDDRRQFMLDG